MTSHNPPFFVGERRMTDYVLKLRFNSGLVYD